MSNFLIYGKFGSISTQLIAVNVWHGFLTCAGFALMVRGVLGCDETVCILHIFMSSFILDMKSI